MSIKNRINIIALLSIGAILTLYGYLWFTTFQINRQFNQIRKIEHFSRTVSQLYIVTEDYLAYDRRGHLKNWDKIFSDLHNRKEVIRESSRRKIINNSLSSIKGAFELIKKVRRHPDVYRKPERRTQLMERAKARIRSDIQLLLALSNNAANKYREAIHSTQLSQRTRILLFLIPIVLLIFYMIYRLRKRITTSLKDLLEGAREIAAGNFNTSLEIGGSDEHSRLANELNTMTKKLRSYVNREKEAREKAEDNRQRWEKLVEQDPNLIMIHIDGNLQFINPAGVELIGADNASQVIGHSIYEMIDETYIEKAEKQIQQVLIEGNRISPTIYKVNTLDGEERYMQMESMPIKYYDQDAVQTVGLDITEHIEYEEKLEKSLEEKTTLLQEVHHRVKNNLAVISGMMELQAMDSSNDQFVHEIQDSQLRIKSMALIHEMLYESESFSDLDFKDQIKKIIDTIVDTLRADKQIKVEYDLEELQLNVNQAIPCSLIVNELITNSLKHAFNDSEEGAIYIALKEVDNRIHLKVADDGRGLPDSVDPERSDTLGFKIINTLIKQLQATLDYHTNNGTTFNLSFERADIKGSGSHHSI